MYARDRKEESTELLQSLLKKLPAENRVEDTGDLAKLRRTLWLYGYRPDLQFIAPTPNCMAMMKVLMTGEIKWILFEMHSLMKAVQAIEGKYLSEYNMQSVKAYVEALNAEKLGDLKKLGTMVVAVLQKPQETLYVPGWLCEEEVG